MKKILTLFERDWDGDRSRVLPVIAEGCGWVRDGEAVATRKYDGTCCLIKDGKLFKRREVKENKPDPEGFVLVNNDQVTHKRVGWVPVTKHDKWHLEAFAKTPPEISGTCELIGPKVQGNPEKVDSHFLIIHSLAETFMHCPTDYEGIKEFLSGMDIEGIVWRYPTGHPNERMCKIKKKDFGMGRAD